MITYKWWGASVILRYSMWDRDIYKTHAVAAKNSTHIARYNVWKVFYWLDDPSSGVGNSS